METLALREAEHPQFAASRFEVSFPLIVRGAVLGILDIHTMQPKFSEADMQLFHIVADYATSALDTSRLVADLRVSVQETQALYTRAADESWRMLLEMEQMESYTAGPVALTASSAQETITAAMLAGEPRSLLFAQETDSMYLLVVPLVARGLRLGYLAFTRAAANGDWDAPTRTLIGAAAERLALALDNTRLLVETRRQAFYEEQLGRIGDLVWEKPNFDAILTRSVRELGTLLEASDVGIYITPAQASPDARAAVRETEVRA